MEANQRVQMYNVLLQTPHRQLEEFFKPHKQVLEEDPAFYLHLAAWYDKNGKIRDHKEMFIINLVSHNEPDYRNVGLALLRKLPPYQVRRVLDYVKGTVNRVKSNGDIQEKKTGLFLNVPRALKTEITRYLKEREEKPEWFDDCVLHARSSIKRLYASLHIKPSEYAQAVLFDDNPPEGSALYIVKILSRENDPAKQAHLIAEHRIPYRVASTVIKGMNPVIITALLDVMTPQEVINNMNSLKKRGVLDNPILKSLVDDKLKKAKKDKNVTAYKAKVAAEVSGVTGETKKQLEAVTETQIKERGTIKRPLLLLIDKSGSMDQAIEVGKQLGSMIAAICEADMYTYVFDQVAYPIMPIDNSLVSWENVLKHVRAGGQTSCGIGVMTALKQKKYVEQIILVTDEGENLSPKFVHAYDKYAQEMNVRPDVIIVHVGGICDHIQRDCRQANIQCDYFHFQGDYYALEGVIPFLTKGSMIDLILEIMETPLPRRKAA